MLCIRMRESRVLSLVHRVTPHQNVYVQVQKYWCSLDVFVLMTLKCDFFSHFPCIAIGTCDCILMRKAENLPTN